CNRPVLLDWRICRDMQTIGLRAVKTVAIPVTDGNQIELCGTRSLNGDVAVGIEQAASIGGISLVVSVSRALSIHRLLECWQHPVAVAVERRGGRIVALLPPSLCFAHGRGGGLSPPFP